MHLRELKIETPQGSTFAALSQPETPRLAALFIGGSGPHDRDGRNGKFYADYDTWAQVWADQGIATLRLDKPGSGPSPLPLKRPIRYAHDLLRYEAALEVLKNHMPGLPLALIGHGLGALSALELPQQGLCAIAHMAGMGRALDRLIAHQLMEALEKAETPAKEIATHIAERIDLVETFKQGGVIKNLPPWAGKDPEVWIHLSDIARRDPVTLLATCPTPLCLIQGTADTYVYSEDWRLCRASAPKAPALLVEGMDHLFKGPTRAVNAKALQWVGERLLAHT